MKKAIVMGMFAILFTMPALSVTPNKYVFTKGNSSLVWKAKGKSLVGNGSDFDITGRGGFIEGEVVEEGGKYNGTLLVDVRGFETGIKKRDGHVQDYLDSKSHPVSSLVLKKVEQKTNSFEGDLTIKGKTKAIFGYFKMDASHLKAIFKVKVSDYPIGKVSYLGFGIEDEIEVEVNADFPF